MKKLLLVLSVILVFAFNLSAQSFTQWKPLKQFIKESDLIVSGTLYSVSRYTNDDIDYSEGIIVIEEFISGNIKTTEGSPLKVGDKIKLTWQNPSAKIYDRVELGGSEDNEVIWILKVKSDGTVTADNYFSIRSAGTNPRRELKEISRKDKTRKDLRKVKLFNEIDLGINNQNWQTQSPKMIQDHSIEVDNKTSEHSFLAALMTILFSLNFYWILYRSRFKIR